MTTLAFVAWVIGWPTACQWQLAYSKKCGIEYSEAVRGFAALIQMTVWVGIACLIWNNR